ncbi:protein GL2-INTERACTING REPRESSOR 1-like [Humulus lupulus]|uniref:protein GL2-INTERACTING REPRESSOR 1-like n=1 Tax=Humulus lupulus TaxID=3486 RepID=UPI002B402D90|nr:protein GL2-INTERACTING REPRESSOR 1-like [Humulus lupulus]
MSQRNHHMQLNLNLPRPPPRRQREETPEPNSPSSAGESSASSSSESSSTSEMSIDGSCVSSEAEQESMMSSPESVRTAAAPMVLAGCPRCLMYVMLSDANPKCPKCKSTVLLDFLNDETNNNKKTRT